VKSISIAWYLTVPVKSIVINRDCMIVRQELHVTYMKQNKQNWESGTFSVTGGDQKIKKYFSYKTKERVNIYWER